MIRKCAVCGDTNQSNIIFKWQRHSDNTVFHICGLCAETPNKVNAESVKIQVDNKYTTVDSEFVASNDNGTFRQRPKSVTSFYRGKSNLTGKR